MSEVDDEFVAYAVDADRLKGAHHLHVGTHGTPERAVGQGHPFGGAPLLVVEARLCPCAEFLAGIINLPVILVV